MKFFNTAGPVNRPDYYKVDPLQRWDLPEMINLINQEKYFILHAPRQTGKTSSLLALQEYLNHEGKYLAVYANFEVGQASRNDLKSGLRAIVSEISNRMSLLLKDRAIVKTLLAIFDESEAENGLNSIISHISQITGKPVVFFIDEIDALVGDTLVSVLRQIRAGYDKRPENFPASIILCGVRDIKDYRIHLGNNDIITGGCAFNIKAKSLRLGNFTKEDIVNLYSQHTVETGQKFNDDCFDFIWINTGGQPWLVNALANEVTYEIKENRDRSIIITKEMLEVAKNNLILQRQTHLDQLADKLKEERVQRVILPMILGEDGNAADDDKEYCYDLGLITKTDRGFDISNQIYREIIPRELTKEHQDNFAARYAPDWVKADGSLDTEMILQLFQDFWRENSGIWASHIKGYQEAAPQLVFQAFLQRVSNGKGQIYREYAVARGRTDLMLKWQNQKIVIEIKTLNSKQKYETVKQKALEQTAKYAEIMAATESHILVFDRDEKMGWREKVFIDYGEFDGIKIKIWGM